MGKNEINQFKAGGRLVILLCEIEIIFAGQISQFIVENNGDLTGKDLIANPSTFYQALLCGKDKPDLHIQRAVLGVDITS